MRFSPSSTTFRGTDDFADLTGSPFDIKECITEYNTSSGKNEVTAYEGDSNWNTALSSSTHNRMIEFPKFYYKRPKRYQFLVSDSQFTGAKLSPMHYRNGVLHDKVYIGKYSTNTNFYSQSGTTVYKWTTSSLNYPAKSHSANDQRSKLRNNHLYMFDAVAYFMIKMLIMIKYGAFNLNDILGLGWYNDNYGTMQIINGYSDNILTKDGYSGTNINDSSSHLKVFGIEDFYGQRAVMVDGLFCHRSKPYLYINENIDQVISTPETTSDNVAGFTKISTPYPNPSFSGSVCFEISEWAYDQTYDYLTYASGYKTSYDRTPSFNAVPDSFYQAIAASQSFKSAGWRYSITRSDTNTTQILTPGGYIGLPSAGCNTFTNESFFYTENHESSGTTRPMFCHKVLVEYLYCIF